MLPDFGHVVSGQIVFKMASYTKYVSNVHMVPLQSCKKIDPARLYRMTPNGIYGPAWLGWTNVEKPARYPRDGAIVGN